MSLDLDLPTVGGDSGTWGSEINNAITALNDRIIAAVRTTDSAGLGSATLADDSVLQLDLAAGTWDIDLRILATGSANTCDLKIAWAFGGTLTGSWRAGMGPSSEMEWALTNGTDVEAAAGATTAAITGAVVYGVDGTNITYAHEEGTLIVSAAGTLTVQTANNSGAGTTTVKAGSRLRAIQLA